MDAPAAMDPQVSIGEALRRRREERGLTAEQAAFQSKVPLRLVQVLESDDYQLLPDPLYLVRLLHEYAMFLGLNAATLEAEFQQVIQRPPRTSLAPVPAPRPTSTIPWRQVLWTVAAILVVAPVVLIALSLGLKARRRPRCPDPARRVAAGGCRVSQRWGGGIERPTAGRVGAVCAALCCGALAGHGGRPCCGDARHGTTAQNGRRCLRRFGRPRPHRPCPRADLDVRPSGSQGSTGGPVAGRADSAVRGGDGVSRHGGQRWRSDTGLQRDAASPAGPFGRGDS